MYYRNANCAVVVYDITQSASLEKARTWIRELQRQADPSIVIALCGNKSDLAALRQVTQEEAQKYAEEEGLMWAETSAKSGEGVNDIFTAIGEFPVLILSLRLSSFPYRLLRAPFIASLPSIFISIRLTTTYHYSKEAAIDSNAFCKSWRKPCIRSWRQSWRGSEQAVEHTRRVE